MNIQEFLRDIPKAGPPPVVLFCPAKAPRAREASWEPMLAEQAITAITDKYVDPSLRDLAYTVYYADETKPGEIVLEAQTLPFLAERRVILVRNAERFNNEAAAGAILHYLKAPTDSTILLFVAAVVDKRLKFYKACEKSGLIVDCPELTDRELAQWVREHVETMGKSIENAAAQELLRRAGGKLSDVRNALEVVSGYVQSASLIREQDVVAACADVAEEEIWTLTDSIAASQPAVAIRALHKLMDLGQAEDQLLGSINWLLKTAYAVARDENAPGISPYVAQKVMPLARKIGLKKMKDAFALATSTHFLIRSTGVDSALALELLVTKLAAPRKKQ